MIIVNMVNPVVTLLIKNTSRQILVYYVYNSRHLFFYYKVILFHIVLYHLSLNFDLYQVFLITMQCTLFGDAQNGAPRRAGLLPSPPGGVTHTSQAFPHLRKNIPPASLHLPPAPKEPLHLQHGYMKANQINPDINTR